MANIPSDALVYKGHKYYIYSNVVDTWEEAKAYCESLGGHLAVINDEEENTALYNYGNEKGYTGAYFGLSDAEKEGSWTCVDGTEVKYTNWEVGEPNNSGGYEDYAELSFSWKGKWNDISSRKNFPFICEWENCEWENTWTISGTTAKYGTPDKTLVTVSGIKSTKGLSINDNVVTVANSSVNKAKITVSSGYTLKLADDVPSPTTEKAVWSLTDTTATYKQTTSAGYTLANNAITYSDSSTKDLVTVSGIKSTKGLSINDKVVTVANSSVNKAKITVSSGYNLKLADDVDKPTTKKSAWSLDGSTATYKSSYKTGGYKLASNAKSITYTGATKATTLATIKGAKAKPTISNDVIKLKTSTINSKVTLSGSYEFDFASGDYKKAKITGSSSADKITSRGKNISINGGAGDDTIKIYGSATSVKGGNGADVFVFSGGSGVITDYAAEDKISITSGTVSATTSGDNVILTAGSKKITVKGGKDKKITYFDTDGEHSYPKVDDGKYVALTEDFDEEIYTFGSKLRTLDASATQLPLSIVGNNFMNSVVGSLDDDTIDGGVGADTIFGNDGNDILTGGKGNDILTGGDGADVFVWNKGDGNDLITDYAEEDIISISGDTIKSFKASSDDIIITLASKSKITVVGGKDKLITYVDAKGEHIYPEIFTVKGKTITLTDEYTKKSFAIDDYGSYTKVNASAVDHGLNIVGNSSANSIMGTADSDTIDGGGSNDTIRGSEGNDSLFGGSGKDYLYGGEGNDTLWGGNGNDWLEDGDGSDLFIYSAGNDSIKGYEQGIDKIMILSNEKPALVDNSDGDAVFSVGNGELFVKNGANTTITFVKSNGKSLWTYTKR